MKHELKGKATAAILLAVGIVAFVCSVIKFESNGNNSSLLSDYELEDRRLVIQTEFQQDDKDHKQQQQHLPNLLDPASGNETKRFIYIMKFSGLGSQLINMLAYKIYFCDNGREFMVDESRYRYRRNEHVGVLTGHFLPSFPVVDHKGQYSEMDLWINKQYGKQPKTYEEAVVHTDFKRKDKKKSLIISHLNLPQMKEIKEKYGQFSLSFYERMATEACTDLQFNEWAKHRMGEIKRLHKIPDFKSIGGNSVAFHVRRGDKLVLEARKYNGTEYVDTLLNITSEPIEHCFIASGDYTAVEETIQALHDHKVDCTVHTLTQASQKGAYDAANHINKNETISFMTELSMMIDATYFIGTFNSNVGSLVALLRKCVHTTAPHYANSYGADGDYWFYY